MLGIIHSMETTIYPVSKLGQGSLAVMARPDQTNLAENFRAIQSTGATHVVSLLENIEAENLGLGEEASWCAKHRMEFMHYPIADFSTPANLDQFLEFTRTLYALIEDGAHIVIHCRGGIGRAGTTASSVLLHAGVGASEAMHTVSKARGVSVPETEDQKAFIRDVEKRIEI